MKASSTYLSADGGAVCRQESSLHECKDNQEECVNTWAQLIIQADLQVPLRTQQDCKYNDANGTLLNASRLDSSCNGDQAARSNSRQGAGALQVGSGSACSACAHGNALPVTAGGRRTVLLQSTAAGLRWRRVVLRGRLVRRRVVLGSACVRARKPALSILLHSSSSLLRQTSRKKEGEREDEREREKGSEKL